MKEIFINKNRACSVTGHRVLQKDFNKESLKNQFIALIESGIDTFLIGMAIGFDTACFKILTILKERYSQIKLVACVPCKTQPNRYSETQKKEYYEMLDIADGIFVLSQEYTARCMQKRNEFMVDNSNILIAYLRRDIGGTANTVKYAKKVGIKIIFV